MTPQQILTSLKAEGIELGIEQRNLKVQSTKAKITDAQKSFIAANKPALLALLGNDEHNCGSLEQSKPQATVDIPPTQNQSPAESGVFKEYKLSNGEMLRLTKDEFDRVVDLLRFLHQYSQKIINRGTAD